MRTIWVEALADGTYAISTEYHDGIVYMAKSIDEAVEKYEADRGCSVGTIHFWDDVSGSRKTMEKFSEEH